MAFRTRRAARGFCMLVLLVAAVPAGAAIFEVDPTHWVDVDKTHVAAELCGGTSWHTNYYEDANQNGQFDPGEAWDEEADPAWQYPQQASDGSCWMATAASLIQGRGGAADYRNWAYNVGLTGSFPHPDGSMTPLKTYTFESGGQVHYALEASGRAHTTMAKTGTLYRWFDPVGYMAAQLGEANPVGLSLRDGAGDAHSLAVWKIDTLAREITVSNSDSDTSNYLTYAYTYDPATATLMLPAYPAATQDVWYMTAIEGLAWFGRPAGSWYTSTNWANLHTPTAGQNVYLNQAGLTQVAVNEAGATAHNLLIDLDAQTNFVSVTGEGSLTVTGDLVVAKSGDRWGMLSQAPADGHDPAVNVAGQLIVGQEASGLPADGPDYNGTYSLVGGTLTASAESVGHWGRGRFLQTGGTNQMPAGTLVVGADFFSVGLYELKDGDLIAPTQIIGAAAKGTVLQTGGVNTCGTNLLIGRDSAANGLYVIENGTLAANVLTAGNSGSGAIDIKGGTVTVADDFYLGVFAGSHGTCDHSAGAVGVTSDLVLGWMTNSEGVYTLSNTGDLTTTNSTHVGFAGKGTFNQTGGTHTVRGMFFVGGPGGDGTYNLSGNASTLSSPVAFVGHHGKGEVVQEGGTHSVENQLYIGRESTAVGTYRLQGGALEAWYLSVGSKGRGTVDHSGGTAKPTLLSIGSESGAVGTYTLRNTATLEVPGVAAVGEYGQGTFFHQGGRSQFDGSLTLGAMAGAEGQYNLSCLVPNSPVGPCDLTVGLDLVVGDAGQGAFNHLGGRVEVADDFIIGNEATSIGHAHMTVPSPTHASVLTVKDDGHLGVRGQAFLTIADGICVIEDDLALGLADSGKGVVTVEGGWLDVRGTCEVGSQDGAGGAGYGELVLEGGGGKFWDLIVGDQLNGSAKLVVRNQSAFRVANRFRIGPRTTLQADPGALFRMTGATVDIESNDPAALAGLANMTFVFEGGPGVIDTFEVAGLDHGADPAGMDLNFAVGGIVLGGANGIGWLELVDTTANLGGGQGALYVDELIVGSGCTLDLAGLNLYACSFTDLGGSFPGGLPTLVPEPATLTLLGLGALGVLRRR